MEDYPPEYVEHNLPLIIVSGLGQQSSSSSGSHKSSRQESGTRIALESAECFEGRAKAVLEQLESFDGTIQTWSPSSNAGSLRYHIKTIGRTYTLPPRKAAPLPQAPLADPLLNKQASNELHSPLSPLSPGSPVFPDGIMSPMWFAKHQQHVPALLLAFFDITTEGGTVQDNITKADINAVKTALSRSGFRVRFAAVLVSDKSILQAPELDERIAAIRRATSLDGKNGLFFMPPMSTSEEVAVFVANMLTTLRPVCIEYYRELTKHARRKKTRATVPATPITPVLSTSQALPTSGWNVRYEVKQGIFAEFRQETEAAERHYSQAVYDLCGEDGVFETTNSWSPRWDEARLLADTLALRVIKCLLRTGATSSAARSWYEYRNRMRSIMDRKGKGTTNYGWKAWEARWAQAMAELVRAAGLPSLDNPLTPKHERATGGELLVTHVAAEKAMPSFERLPAVHLLHHAGYWFRSALTHAHARMLSAIQIPSEDRTPAGQSPASSVARKAEMYDTYLVPEPHDEYESAKPETRFTMLAQLTEQAVIDFAERDQRRMCDELKLQLAVELVDTGAIEHAFELLVPVWDATRWRYEDWHQLFQRLLKLLHKCAVKVRNAEIALATRWELISLPAVDSQEEDISVSQLLESLDVPSEKRVALDFQNDDRLSPIALFFSFDSTGAYAGEPLRCQLCMRNDTSAPSAPTSISELQLVISSQAVVTLSHKPNEPASPFTYIRLDKTDRGLGTTVDLTVAPGELRVIDFDLTFREADVVHLEKLAMVASGEGYVITHLLTDPGLLHTPNWYSYSSGAVTSTELRSENSTVIEVLPKPPKIDFEVKNIKAQYFASETPLIRIRVVNQEAQSIHGTLSVQTMSQDNALNLATSVGMTDSVEGDVHGGSESIDIASADGQAIVVRVMPPSQPSNWITTLAIQYELEEAPGVSLTKTVDLPIQFIRLLDIKWSFEPLLYVGGWPSYFHASQDDKSAIGIPQKWRAALTARSSASTAIVIKKAFTRLAAELNDAVCLMDDLHDAEEQVLKPNQVLNRDFPLMTQKLSPDDRRPISLDLVGTIDWSFEGSTDIHTLNTIVPRVNLPSSEPRVLCTTSKEEQSQGTDAAIHYSLENPSMHFLTFAITMEASEDFAYCGVKSRTLSLAPFSRVSMAYGIVLHDKADASSNAVSTGRWISPNLQVVDSYYHKTLHVQPAGPGVRSDKEGRINVWVEAESA